MTKGLLQGKKLPRSKLPICLADTLIIHAAYKTKQYLRHNQKQCETVRYFSPLFSKYEYDYNPGLLNMGKYVLF